MKKKTVVVFIIVIQFILIVCLSLFSLLKMVEENKYMVLAAENGKNVAKQEIILRQQIDAIKQELKKCQEKK